MRIRRLAIVLVAVIALGSGGLAYAAFNPPPTPQEILNHAASALQALQDGHAVLAIEGSSSQYSGSATVEVWAKKLSDGNPPSYALRAEVLQASDARLQGAIAASDGHTVWLYAPSQNTVWTGSVDQMRQMGGNDTTLPPMSSQDLVQKVLDYATVTLAGTEPVQGHAAYKLQLVPRADKVPAAAAGASGVLWIDTARWIPLQASVNAGSMGQGHVTATTLELNTGLPDTLFHFQIPDGAKVVPLPNQQVQHLSLGDANAAAGSNVLQPSYVPSGATLVDVVKMGETIVLRYETAQGSFAIAEGGQDKTSAANTPGESVSVRGVTGKLVTGTTGNDVLLVWTENGRTYSVSGAISSQEALQIAASLQ